MRPQYVSSESEGRLLSVSQGVGKPTHKPRLTLRDSLSLLVVALCLTFAVNVIGNPRFAFSLGQTNQLVLLGFLLSLLALCFQKQALGLLLLVQAKHGRSTLQNYDAILRFDAFAEKISILVRFSILFLFALPLVIGAVYKLFVGGLIIRDGGSKGGLFGLTGPPGTQRLGKGISLMVNATLPFIVRPALMTTYGYNMFVISNSTTAMLDAPVPAYVSELQSQLSDTRSIEISALVNATICSRLDIDENQRHNKSWGDDADTIPLYPGTFGFLTDNYDHSIMYTSQYGSPRWREFETFASQAVGSILTRGRCHGTWSITMTSTNLLNASCSDAELTYGNQSIISYNFIDLHLYTAQLAEFITYPYNNSQQNPDNVELAIPVVAAMVWSRITSLNGPENANASWLPPENHFPNPKFGQGSIEYYSALTNVQVKSVALKRSWALYVVIATYPLLTLLAIGLKMSMYYTPIAEGFGLISILAGLVSDRSDSDRSVDENNILRGATLSGKLKREVRMSIGVLEDKQYELALRNGTQQDQGYTGSYGEIGTAPHLQYKLDGQTANGKLKRNSVYH